MKKILFSLLLVLSTQCFSEDRTVTSIHTNDKFTFMMFDKTFFYFDGFAVGSSITILSNDNVQIHNGSRIKSIFKNAKYDCKKRLIYQGDEILLGHDKKVITNPPKSNGWTKVLPDTVAFYEIKYICDGTLE